MTGGGIFPLAISKIRCIVYEWKFLKIIFFLCFHKMVIKLLNIVSSEQQNCFYEIPKEILSFGFQYTSNRRILAYIYSDEKTHMHPNFVINLRCCPNKPLLRRWIFHRRWFQDRYISQSNAMYRLNVKPSMWKYRIIHILFKAPNHLLVYISCDINRYYTKSIISYTEQECYGKTYKGVMFFIISALKLMGLNLM